MERKQEKHKIISTMREQPQRIHRLWIKKGYEHVSDEILKEAKRLGVPFRIIPSEAFTRKFREPGIHLFLEQDVVASADPDLFLKEILQRHQPVVCAFDGIYDPQNLGNIMRSAACLEIDGVIMPKDKACGITATVASVAKGGLDHVPVVRVVNLVRFMETLKRSGFFCYGLDEKGPVSLWDADLTGPVCLVFGNESGLRTLTRERCDQVLRISTTPSFPSLNVATSFAIAAYEARRQRLAKDQS